MSEYNKEPLFYLKLGKGFFDKAFVKILENYPSGNNYVVLLVKLACESVPYNGYLRMSERIPYTPETLSVITRTPLNVVVEALKIYQELDIIDYTEDGTIFIKFVPPMTAKTTVGALKKQIQKENGKDEK